jgi:hypothetical protein
MLKPNFIYIEKDSFRILVKNNENEKRDFTITKTNNLYIVNQAISNLNNASLDFLFHNLYLLYFNDENTEKPVRIIEKRSL